MVGLMNRILAFALVVVTPGCGSLLDRAVCREVGQSVYAVQDIEITANGNQFRGRCILEWDTEQFTLVGLTPLQTRLFSISQSRGRVDQESLPFFRLPLDGERIIRYYSWLYGGCDLPLEASDESEAMVYRSHGRERFRVKAFENPLSMGDAWVHDLEAGVLIRVETLTAESL